MKHLRLDRSPRVEVPFPFEGVPLAAGQSPAQSGRWHGLLCVRSSNGLRPCFRALWVARRRRGELT